MRNFTGLPEWIEPIDKGVQGLDQEISRIDPALQLFCNHKKHKYEIHRFSQGMWHHVMTIPLDELDSRVLSRLRRGDLWNRRLSDVARELEVQEETYRKRQEAHQDSERLALFKDSVKHIYGDKQIQVNFGDPRYNGRKAI